MSHPGRRPATATGTPRFRRREAGRVILLDGLDRVLLLRGSDPRRRGESWWMTPGGGLEEGESHRECAARETAEETGYVLRLGRTPCLEREIEFPFDGRWYRQRELFYPARLPDSAGPTAAGRAETAWTDLERRTLLEVRWWSLPELRVTEDVVYPNGLVDLVTKLVTDGWG